MSSKGKKNSNNNTDEMNNEFSIGPIGPGEIITDEKLIDELEKEYASGNLVPIEEVHAVPLGFLDRTVFPETKNYTSYTNIEHLLELAKQGDAIAQNNLGIKYIKQDTETDAIKAKYWFLEAAKQGEECAIANLGRCLMEGHGIKKDVTAAINMFAWANLMGIESVDDYVIHNAKIEELIPLSNNGNAKAQYYLGLCYLFGTNIKQNVQKAFDLFIQSAENNEVLSKIILARSLANGICVEKDLFHAKCILNESIDIAEQEVGIKGVKRVKKEIAIIRNRISEESPFILMKIIPSCSKEDQEKGIPADKYLHDFLNGKLFMKTLSQFADLKHRDKASKNNYRGDTLEALSQSFGCGFNPYYFTTDSKGNIIKDGTLGLIDTLTLRKKVFCLTAIDYFQSKKAFIKPSKKMKEFGEYAVIITDANEFLKRVRDSLDRLSKADNANYRIEYGKVGYGIDFSEFKQYNEFVKSDLYQYQNEFRISIDFSEGRYSSKVLDEVNEVTKLTFPSKIEIDNNPLSLNEAITLDIGDIHDICIPISTETFFEKSSFRFDQHVHPQIVQPYHPIRNPYPTFCKGVFAVTNADGSKSLAFSEEAYFYAVV